MRRSLRVAAALFGLILLSLPASAAVTVIFVRHAERATVPGADPPISPEGKRRAERLAITLADAGVTAIYTTEYKRTQETAGPSAERFHLTPVTLPGADTDRLVAALRQVQSGTVLVVGHSNTVPKAISQLGGPSTTIDENQFDNLFVLTLGTGQVGFVRLHYGEPSSLSPASRTAPAQQMLEKR